MTEQAGELHLERLLADALRPIDPPEDLATRVESTLSSIAEHAAAELSNWADELSEGELEALRDPRNWVRPVAAVAVGGAAAAALLVVEARRRRRPHGVRDTAERFLRDLT
jgi:H+/Cl- antiporter ClcA